MKKRNRERDTRRKYEYDQPYNQEQQVQGEQYKPDSFAAELNNDHVVEEQKIPAPIRPKMNTVVKVDDPMDLEGISGHQDGIKQVKEGIYSHIS